MQSHSTLTSSPNTQIHSSRPPPGQAPSSPPASPPTVSHSFPAAENTLTPKSDLDDNQTVDSLDYYTSPQSTLMLSVQRGPPTTHAQVHMPQNTTVVTGPPTQSTSTTTPNHFQRTPPTHTQHPPTSTTQPHVPSHSGILATSRCPPPGPAPSVLVTSTVDPLYDYGLSPLSSTERIPSTKPLPTLPSQNISDMQSSPTPQGVGKPTSNETPTNSTPTPTKSSSQLTIKPQDHPPNLILNSITPTALPPAGPAPTAIPPAGPAPTIIPPPKLETQQIRISSPPPARAPSVTPGSRSPTGPFTASSKNQAINHMPPSCPAIPPAGPAPTAIPPAGPAPTAIPPANHAPAAVPPAGPAPTVIPPSSPAPTAVPPAGPAPTAIPPANPAPTAIPPAGPAPTAIPPAGPAPTVIPPSSPAPTAIPPAGPAPTAIPPANHAPAVPPAGPAPTAILPAGPAPTIPPANSAAIPPANLAPTTIPPAGPAPTGTQPSTSSHLPPGTQPQTGSLRGPSQKQLPPLFQRIPPHQVRPKSQGPPNGTAPGPPTGTVPSTRVGPAPGPPTSPAPGPPTSVAPGPPNCTAPGLPSTAPTIATYTLDDYGIPLSAPITTLGPPSACSPVNSLGDYGTPQHTLTDTPSSYNGDSSLAQYESLLVDPYRSPQQVSQTNSSSPAGSAGSYSLLMGFTI